MPSWNCCVMNCKNNTHGPLRFFSFPKDEERRQLWAESCGRRNWYPTDLSRICEVHFDKSQFEQNQQDGNKLLKWSAIPRMYEEWNKEPTSLTVEHLEKSHEYDNVADTEDFRSSSIDEELLDDESEGMLEPEWRKRKRLERKRANSDKLDSEDYQPIKRSRKKMSAFGKTDELEDELSRIKADIKRIMEDGDTEQASNPRHSSPISAMTNRHSNLKESKYSPGTTMLSPSSYHKQYSQDTNSAYLQFRRQLEHANQSNTRPGMKTIQSSGLLQKPFTRESSSVGKTHAAYDKQQRLQRTEGVRNIIPSSQLTKKMESSQMQSLESIAKRNSVLRDILSDKKKDSLEKPWRAPDELVQFMNNTRVCFAPGETIETQTASAVGSKRKPINNAQKTKAGQSDNVSEDERMDETLLRTDKNPSNSSAKITVPRIVKVQSLNLTKGARIKNEASSSSSKDADVIQTPSMIELENNLLKGARVKKVVIPRIIKIQDVGTTKTGSKEIIETETDIGKIGTSSMSEDTTAAIETPSRIAKGQMNILSKDLRYVKGTSNTDETLEETIKNQNSPEVPVTSNDKRSRTKTNGNVGNIPESKSARLKKLLASMLSIEEDIYSDEESDLEILEKSNENRKKNKKKIEVGVQVDAAQMKQVIELKAEIAKLKQELEINNKTIMQLRQSLAAILPPDKMIMLTENGERYMVFNQQKA